MSLNEKKHKKKEKILPFYNLNFLRQIDVLKAYVAFYEKKKKAAHYKDISSIAKVHNTQVSGSRKFWRSLNFLEEKDGSDIPTEITLDFVRKMEWGKEEDAWKLFRNHIKDAWFSNHVEMALRLQKMMSHDELINSLGSAAGVHRKGKHIVESLSVLIKLITSSRITEKDEKTGKYRLHPEMVKGIEPLEFPEQKEDLIIVIIDNERYAVPLKELEKVVKESGKKITSKEYRIR